MRFLRLATLACICGTLALSGCTGSTNGAPAAGSVAARIAQPPQNCINPLLEFVSDSTSGDVYVYNGSSPGACLVISNLPKAKGMDVNSSGTLYVASAAAHSIVVFKAPYTSVSQVISDGPRAPGDVALCKGYIAAPNLTTNTITIFSYAGAILRILAAHSGSQELFATCDSAGNLYTDGTLGGATYVAEFKSGKGAPISLSSVASAVTKPGGLEWEQNALWIDDQSGLSISIWPAPFSTAAKTIHLSGALDPIKFEIAPSDGKILSADAGLDRAVFYDLAGSPTGALNPFVGGGSLVGANFNKDDSP
ncbi:MAG TPA: hypothetical protein VGZ02_05770 [Candidatus Baltobacteraceae bacterium]|jgi:hypothetical protein|nr:hypothetical protein [Candidatus Baltobacteraceae bacterium]